MEIMEVNERLAEELTEAELKVIECGNKGQEHWTPFTHNTALWSLHH